MCIFGNRYAPLLTAMKTDTHCVFIAFALGRGLAKRPEDPFRTTGLLTHGVLAYIGNQIDGDSHHGVDRCFLLLVPITFSYCL